MTMIASAPQHLQVRCSAPTFTVSQRVKESTTLSPAQVSLRDSATSTTATTANEHSTAGVTSHQALEARTTTSLAFVYGTLKRGFGNHWLIEEQLSKKHCRLVGTARTKLKYPLVCGPFQVPFLLDVCGSGQHVHGELYAVDGHCLGLLDDLEGISKGHYVRCPLTLTGLELDPSFGPDVLQQQGCQISSKVGADVEAEAYFAANHFTSGLYSAAPHIEAYTEKESATYTRRMHRPQNRTFVEHVYHWIDEKQGMTCATPYMVKSN
ncbi:unnamed protein product [Calypogeia fissa]